MYGKILRSSKQKQVKGMLISLDCETGEIKNNKFIPELNTQKLVLADIYDGREHYTSKDKKRIWQKIQHLASKENKNNKVLTIAGHNMQYDFYCIANWKQEGLKILCERPFIATQQDKNGKNQISFIDTWQNFRMKLSNAAELIGQQKLEMPEGQSAAQIIPYVQQDTKLARDLITNLKEWCKQQGVIIRRTITINQVAINFMLTKLRKQKIDNTHMFQDKAKTTLRKPSIFYDKDNNIIENRADLIHQAYRTGRNECFQTGIFTNVHCIDKKSMYPWAATTFRMPDLRTEKKIRTPLKHMQAKDLLMRIGITNCIIRNDNNELGILPIRSTEKNSKNETKIVNHYLRPGQTGIGTWTNEELMYAIQNGHTIIDSEWSIVYQDAINNPIGEYMMEMYQLRQSDPENKLNNYLCKQLMNSAIGKMGQTLKTQEITIASIEDAPELAKKGYIPIKGLDMEYVYKKETPTKAPTKRYYSPTIPTLINAHARVSMNQEYQKIPAKSRLYTDNDSIFTIGDYTHKFKIGNNLGEFEHQYENQEMVIWGNKTYMIGNTIKIGGIRARDITIEDFKNGQVSGRKMYTIKTAPTPEEVGTFKTELRNLKEQLEEHDKLKNTQNERKFYIDAHAGDITYYIETLNELAKQ